MPCILSPPETRQPVLQELLHIPYLSGCLEVFVILQIQIHTRAHLPLLYMDHRRRKRREERVRRLPSRDDLQYLLLTRREQHTVHGTCGE